MSFDLQPVLKGELIELRPLQPEDFEALYAVAKDTLIWEQHPNKDRYKEEVFKVFFRDCGYLSTELLRLFIVKKT